MCHNLFIRFLDMYMLAQNLILADILLADIHSSIYFADSMNF